jgi:hypothetical protein
MAAKRERTLRLNAQWCEAGLDSFQARWLPYCDKRARWLVDGVVLCGGCKKVYLQGRPAREDSQPVPPTERSATR